MGEYVTPGMRLGSVEEYTPGDGAYSRDKHVYASLTGKIVVSASPSGQLPAIGVQIGHKVSSAPKVGDLVTGKVMRVNPRVMHLSIECVGSQSVPEAFSGIVRIENVQERDIDKVVMYECFRPGDVVVAEVISLGDSRSYVCTTARASLGVIFAVSAADATMVPINSQQMQCPVTSTLESRKVANLTAQ